MKKIKVYLEKGIEINMERLIKKVEAYRQYEFIKDCSYEQVLDDWKRREADPFIFIAKNNILRLMSFMQDPNCRQRPTALGVIGDDVSTVYLQRQGYVVGGQTVEGILFAMRQKCWWYDIFIPDLEKGR